MREEANLEIASLTRLLCVSLPKSFLSPLTDWLSDLLFCFSLSFVCLLFRYFDSCAFYFIATCFLMWINSIYRMIGREEERKKKKRHSTINWSPVKEPLRGINSWPLPHEQRSDGRINPTNQSTNQLWINQRFIHSINRSIDQSINQSTE